MRWCLVIKASLPSHLTPKMTFPNASKWPKKIPNYLIYCRKGNSGIVLCLILLFFWRVLASKFQIPDTSSIFTNGLLFSREPLNILLPKCNCRYATLASVSHHANTKHVAGCNTMCKFTDALSKGPTILQPSDALFLWTLRLVDQDQATGPRSQSLSGPDGCNARPPIRMQHQRKEGVASDLSAKTTQALREKREKMKRLFIETELWNLHIITQAYLNYLYDFFA